MLFFFKNWYFYLLIFYFYFRFLNFLILIIIRNKYIFIGFGELLVFFVFIDKSMGSLFILGLMLGVDVEFLLTLKFSGKLSFMFIGFCLIVIGFIFIGDWVRFSVDRSDFVLKWVRGGRLLEEFMVFVV